jgi:hypothetical protein
VNTAARREALDEKAGGMNRPVDDRSVLFDRHFWVGVAMFIAGCLVMSFASSLASGAWFDRNEQADIQIVSQDELGADKAVALWAQFPVTASPRPLVVVGPDYRPPDLGDEARNLAFRLGRWSVPHRLALPPRSFQGYQIRYVGAMLEELRAALEGKAGTEAEEGGLTLGTAEERAARPAVVGAQLETASFMTDRGVRTLPAWIVNFRGQERPLVMLALGDESRYDVRTAQHADSDLRVSPDGMRLTYSFLGDPPGRGPCEAEYAPVVLESPTAIAVGARTYLARGARGDAACGPVAHQRTVTIDLNQPLGERVVVTARFGAPMAPVPVRGAAS